MASAWRTDTTDLLNVSVVSSCSFTDSTESHIPMTMQFHRHVVFHIHTVFGQSIQCCNKRANRLPFLLFPLFTPSMLVDHISILDKVSIKLPTSCCPPPTVKSRGYHQRHHLSSPLMSSPVPSFPCRPGLRLSGISRKVSTSATFLGD